MLPGVFKVNARSKRTGARLAPELPFPIRAHPRNPRFNKAVLTADDADKRGSRHGACFSIRVHSRWLIPALPRMPGPRKMPASP